MPTIVTFDKLLETLPDSDATPYVSDAEYVCVDPDWVKNEFSVSWRMARHLFGLIPSPGDEARDCDDFALGCMVHASRLHRLTQGRPNNISLAFGVVWYRPPEGRHAINVFWKAVNGRPIPIFYEPQLATIKKLSEISIETIRERII